MSTAASPARWAFCTPIATATGNTTLVAAPAAGRALVVQKLTVSITTAAAQAFDIEDSDGTVELFKAPASLAATGNPFVFDLGPLGVTLTAATGLVYTATAVVGLTVAGHGYIKEA